MAANSRDRDPTVPRKPKRTRPQPAAPEPDELYDAYCTRCQKETDHQEGECVPCSSTLYSGPP
jgi:uncharacterized paraquat-inducible protein A